MLDNRTFHTALYHPLLMKGAQTLLKDSKNKDKIPKMTDKQRREMMQALSLFFQIGITMIVCVVIGIFIGRFLDSLFNTAPWLLLIFTFFGAGAAIKFIYDLSKRF